MVLSRDQKSKDGFVFIYKIFDLRTFPHVLHVAVYFQIASVLTHIKHIVLNITTKRNGDQLVQVARGIAQGAAIYAFNVAVSAICADCAATINDIQNEVVNKNWPPS